MQSIPIQLTPSEAIKEFADINQKLSQGVEKLSHLREQDVDIGSTPKDVIYTEDRLKLYHYHPLVEKKNVMKRPFLMTMPLINGYEVADMQPDRSLVRNLLKEGIDVYLLDWGYPMPADKYLTMDDYIDGYLDTCVDVVREQSGSDQLTMFGICQGGTIATTYSALNPEKVKNLVLTVTPIDFQTKHDMKKAHVGLLFHLGRNVDVDLMVDACGNIPADLLNVSFLMASPFVLNFGKYYDLIDMMDNEAGLRNFLRMEKWLFSGPSAAGEAYRQFVKEFLKGNKLVKGELEIGDRKVDLSKATMPILNIYAEKDHLVPPPSTVALGKLVGSKAYTELPINTGHIGIYTGGASQKILAPSVAKWLREQGEA